jgi:glucose-6-phosphate isomerase
LNAVVPVAEILSVFNYPGVYMRIHFDETNLHASMVGEAHGITPAEIKAHLPKAAAALKSFRKASDEQLYGFPALPFDSGLVKAIRGYAEEVRGFYDTVCLVGIGGSALGAWALDCGLRGPHPVQRPFSPAAPRLVVLDNVDPALVEAALEVMNPKKTLVLVIAKSGATAETVATFLMVREWLEKSLGRKASKRIVAVTSHQKGELAALASQEGYRTFPIPVNVGGRFSVLSAVGLVPAALLGVDIRKLLKGAAAMTSLAWEPDIEKNIALRSALLHYLVWQRKKKPIQAAFPYSNRLWGTAFWFRQLWAESLGKARTRDGKLVNVGQTPVAALGTTDQHSQVQLYMEGPNDKVFTFWAVRKPEKPGRIPKRKQGLDAFDYLSGRTLAELLDAERVSTAAALTENGRPNCTFTLDRADEEHLGAFLQLLEFQTAFVGEMLDINAFDQEGVELGKKFTFGLMGRPGFEGYRERFQAYEKKRNAARR